MRPTRKFQPFLYFPATKCSPISLSISRSVPVVLSGRHHWFIVRRCTYSEFQPQVIGPMSLTWASPPPPSWQKIGEIWPVDIATNVQSMPWETQKLGKQLGSCLEDAHVFTKRFSTKLSGISVASNQSDQVFKILYLDSRPNLIITEM